MSISINSVDHGGSSDSFFRDAFNLGGNGGGGGGGGWRGGNNGGLSGWSDSNLVPVGLLDKRFNASESGTTIATEKAKKWWEQRPQEVGDVKVCVDTRGHEHYSFFMRLGIALEEEKEEGDLENTTFRYHQAAKFVMSHTLVTRGVLDWRRCR